MSAPQAPKANASSSIQHIDSHALIQITQDVQFFPQNDSNLYERGTENRNMNSTSKGGTNSYLLIKEKRNHIQQQMMEKTSSTTTYSNSNPSESTPPSMQTSPVSLQLIEKTREDHILYPTPPTKPKKNILSRFSQIYDEERLSQSHPSIPDALNYKDMSDTPVSLLKSNSLTKINTSASLRKAYKVFQDAEIKSVQLIQDENRFDPHSDSETRHSSSLPGSAKKKLLLSRLEMEHGLIDSNKNSEQQAWTTTVSPLQMTRKFRARKGAFIHAKTEPILTIKPECVSGDMIDTSNHGMEENAPMSPIQSQRNHDSVVTTNPLTNHSFHGNESQNISTSNEGLPPQLSDSTFNGHSHVAEKLLSYHQRKQVNRQQVPHAADSMIIQDLTEGPFSNPEKAFSQAMHYLSQEDWQEKMKGLTYVQRLVNHHPKEQICEMLDIHQMILAVVKECKNLRSQVSRMAVDTLTTLITHLEKAVDPELEVCVTCLLQKAGDSNGFIRGEAETSLMSIVDHTTSHRAAQPLLQGASHKNAIIRKTCSMLLTSLTEKMGASKLLLHPHKEFTDKVLITAAQLTCDGNPEARYYARKMFYILMDHPQCHNVCQRCLPHNTWNKVKYLLDNLKLKGLGDLPSSTPAAIINHSESSNRKNISIGDLQDVPSTKVSPCREEGSPFSDYSSQPITPVSSPEDSELTSLCDRLLSPDMHMKRNALKELDSIISSNNERVERHMNQVLRVIIQCLSHENVKFICQSLTVLHHLLPILTRMSISSWRMSLNPLVRELAKLCFQSDTNASTLAERLLDNVTNGLNGNVLIPILIQECHVSKHPLNVILISKISQSCHLLDDHHSHEVILTHVLPHVWNIGRVLAPKGNSFNENDISLKAALTHLTHTLVFRIGRDKFIQSINVYTDEAEENVTVAQFIISLLEEQS